MTSSVQNPADIINIALVSLGHPGRVGNLYDGSIPAKKALDIYAQTRDETLRLKNWPFALRQTPGVTAGSPISGWTYSWAYPTDCLRVRSVAPGTIPLLDYDPQPLLWTIFNNGTLRLILSQMTPVTINYVGQITDMTVWDSLFVNTLVQALCLKLGPSLRNEIAPVVNLESAVTAATSSSELQAPDDADVPVRQQR